MFSKVAGEHKKYKITRNYNTSYKSKNDVYTKQNTAPFLKLSFSLKDKVVRTAGTLCGPLVFLVTRPRLSKGKKKRLSKANMVWCKSKSIIDLYHAMLKQKISHG